MGNRKKDIILILNDNKYTFYALREKVIYLNTYETWKKRNY